MKDPGFYPNPVQGPEFIQTHASCIFLTGDLVYKLKKPVDFGFLDYSTPELRRTNGEKEVALNRRLAPKVYLRVDPITLQPHGPALGGGGDPVDWVVVMQQMDQDRLGPRVLDRGELTGAMIDEVVDQMVPFFDDARRDAEVERWGRPEVFKFTTDENFEQTVDFVDTAIPRADYDFLQEYTDRFFRENAELFARRITRGRIRECHGDLHLGNIFFQETPVIFDCIEFNDRLSCTDVAGDLGFLAMDLEFRGQPHLSRRVIQRYVEKSGDEDFLEIVGFYACYRAYVRGKVACLTSSDPALSPEEKAGELEVARKYFDLARRFAGGEVGVVP